jgi:hypothetical protein
MSFNILLWFCLLSCYWGQLLQNYTIQTSGVIEVEIFNHNATQPVYFDDWHITLTANSKPEIVQEVHWVASPIRLLGLGDGR